MMSLCKTVHNLLGFLDPDDRCSSVPRRRRVPPPSNTPGLRCVARELPTPPPHVVESTAVGPRPPVVLPTSPSSPSPSHLKQQQHQLVERIDEGSRGSSYLYGGGGGGGLDICTESLGCESCCDGKMGAEEENAEREIRWRIEDERRSLGRREARSTRRATEVRELPPPLPWLSAGGGNGGRCCSFLKAVRKDGRFILTHFRIERPEVLRASRRDGRLRLELVEREAREAEEENISEVEEAVAEKVEEVEGGGAAEAEEEREEGALSEEDEQRPPAAMGRREGGGGGFRSWRCQEAVRDGVPSSSPFWGTRFVTTA